MPGVITHPDEFPHEHEFTADVVSWANLIIERNPDLPFSSAKFDRRSRGLQKRRDLSLIGKDGRALVTGEVKLPYQKDGATPYNAAVVSDARQKAIRAGVDFFFTWNVNECVLWATDTATGDPTSGSHYKSWKVVSVVKDSHLSLPATEGTIKSWLSLFLIELGKILRGSARVGFKSPDERFVEALESALNLPIRLTFEALEQRYTTERGRALLDRWMRDDQGWTLAVDPEGVRDNLERAAKFSCYALVNRLVFYEALMKRYGAQLHKLSVPEHLDTGDDLRLHLEGFFAEAKQITGDYDTVFGETHSNTGNRIPFFSDFAVRYWRALINQIHEFDFSKLDYEIIGSIFERFISPAERHKYGQYYTRSEVVDLINSFCIRTGREIVIDPACGGGTFLVRAYARKRELAPERAHEQLLTELYGVDVSPFACHLTTINLATRDLVQDENYPLVARADFFDVAVKNHFLSLPVRTRSQGLGIGQHRDIDVPLLDAVVGNPPYVRQEDIRSDKAVGKGHPKRGTKEFYRALVKKESRADLSGRSDLHCYFWPHALTFLKAGGWLCLLTSNQWLDVAYGFKLQKWILSHFKLVAVFESIDEPWFVGARVATAVTILQSCEDADQRCNNLVRFVQLRRPIAEILSRDEITGNAIELTDLFRDEILNLNENTLTNRYRARLVAQSELLGDGIKLSRLMHGVTENSGSDDETEGARHEAVDLAGEYFGGKWGIHLRGPDLWFEFLERVGDQFAPLGELTDVRFGVKSGKDEFFFPRDVTDECLSKCITLHEFQREFGLPRDDVTSGRVKLAGCGEGLKEIRPLETEYLEPEIHSLMEVPGYTVGPDDCRRMILLVGEPKSRLKNSHVLRYIEWGESRGWHKVPTCASRVHENSFWYDLTAHKRPQLVLPKIQQYRLQAFVNPDGLYQNSSLLGIYTTSDAEALQIGAALNSSFALLSRILFARILGNEGTIQLDVYSAKMMLVPVPRPESEVQARAVDAFLRMIQRPTLQLLSERRMRRMALVRNGREAELDELSNLCELDMDDRRDLDDAILEMIGIRDKHERAELIDGLYVYLKSFFEDVRQKEEKAIANKSRSKRKAPTSPAEIASEILADVKDKQGHLLRSYGEFLDVRRPYSTFDLPSVGIAEIYDDIFARDGCVRFIKGRKQIAMLPMKVPEQALLVAFIANQGIRGLTRVPLESEECTNVRSRYAAFVEDRSRRLRELIAIRTGDPEFQDDIYNVLVELILRPPAGR